MAKKWISPLATLTLLILLIITPLSLSSPQFEGFGDQDDDLDLDDSDSDSPPIRLTDSPTLTRSHPSTPPSDPNPTPTQQQQQPTQSSPPPQFDNTYWDEDEFEGLPLPTQPQTHIPDLPSQTQTQPPQPPSDVINTTTSSSSQQPPDSSPLPFNPLNFTVEIACVTFLIIFFINYLTGKKQNEDLALSWATKFATADSIFHKNFSLLGVGDGDDSPLLLKEGQNVFKFYASGRRYCQGLLATIDLKSRHDLISRAYNAVVPCKDEISFEVYMNDDAMDHVVFALARKKVAKGMVKELPDLQKFATLIPAPSGRKWVSEDLAVVSEIKEVAHDFITDVVLDQVFGEKAFEKFGKYFISMHFSDQQSGPHRKKLMFKFALPDINNMADMTRFVTLVPYYIDLVGRYKLSSQARSKADTTRVKAAQEAYKELQYARQEALQRKKAERKKMIDEAEAKLSAEAIRKKEAKERARQMKKGMPKMKMTRA